MYLNTYKHLTVTAVWFSNQIFELKGKKPKNKYWFYKKTPWSKLKSTMLNLKLQHCWSWSSLTLHPRRINPGMLQWLFRVCYMAGETDRLLIPHVQFHMEFVYLLFSWRLAGWANRPPGQAEMQGRQRMDGWGPNLVSLQTGGNIFIVIVQRN